MAEKTLIMLAKNSTEAKRKYPLYASEKFDGVAMNVMKMGGVVMNLSRQNEPMLSLPHVMEYLDQYLKDGDKVIGELFIPRMDFKDSSGIIRRKAPDERVKMGIYDHVQMAYRDNSFETRCIESGNMFHCYNPEDGWPVDAPAAWIKQHRVMREEDLASVKQSIRDKSTQPTFEGWMYRDIAHKFQAGKRSWGMQRETMKGNIDLRVVSVEEALKVKTREPLGMVGRINVWYPHKDEKGKHHDTCGCGPGRLTHDQRTRIWQLFVKEEAARINAEKLINDGDYNAYEIWGVEGVQSRSFVGKIIEIEHKIDPSYNGLRQPTYQALRRDKDVGDNE